MSNVLSLITAAIVACMLLFIYPVSKSYEQQDQVSYSVAYKSVTKFADSVRSKGYITPEMYTDFMRELDLTGNLYKVELQHDQKLYYPIYTDPADPSSFQMDFEVHYQSNYSDHIMDVLFPKDLVSAAERKYYLKQYDYFLVTIHNTNVTKGTLVRQFLNMSPGGDETRIYIPYGGMVLNEDY